MAASQWTFHLSILFLCLFTNRHCLARTTGVSMVFAMQLLHLLWLSSLPGGGYYTSALLADTAALLVLALLPASRMLGRLMLVLGAGILMNCWGLYAYDAGWDIRQAYKDIASLLLVIQTVVMASGHDEPPIIKMKFENRAKLSGKLCWLRKSTS